MPKQTSSIDSLPAEAQEQIIAWLEIESRPAVVERIARPAPDGFGIKTHVTTLNRFYARYLARHRQADLDLATLFAPDTPANPVPAATQSLASHWALQLATKPRRNLSSFKAVTRWVLKQREIEQRDRELRLREQHFSFDREKWEYDIAHQVLLRHAELDQIRRDLTATDAEKIDRARATIFHRPNGGVPLTAHHQSL